MVTIHIPPRLVHETFGRLRGLRALLSSLDTGLPEAAWREEEKLQQRAEASELDAGEFQVEKDVNDERFGFWVPRFAAYSAITLVHSLVETQLFDCLAAVRAKAGGMSRVPKRRGIDRARNQLKTLTGFDASGDGAWPHLVDLENIRNFVVHFGGVPVDAEQTAWLARLASQYQGMVWVSEDVHWYRRHAIVTFRLSGHFVEAADGFFRRVFPSLGFSVDGVRFVK